MNLIYFFKAAIRIVVAYGVVCLLTYKLGFPDVQFLFACMPVVAKVDEKVDTSKAESVKNANITEKTVQTATSGDSFNQKFESLGSKPNVVGKITADITSLDVKQMISENDNLENPLNRKFKISTSFANDQSIANASANVNMFIRLHNKFFSADFKAFSLLKRSSYTAQFTHLVNA